MKVAILVELPVRARTNNPKTTHFCDEKCRRIAKEASRTFKSSFLLPKNSTSDRVIYRKRDNDEEPFWNVKNTGPFSTTIELTTLGTFLLFPIWFPLLVMFLVVFLLVLIVSTCVRGVQRVYYRMN